MTAHIDNGWHMYSQFFVATAVPSRFVCLQSSPNFSIIERREEKPIEEYDKNFDMTLKYFSKSRCSGKK